MNSCDKYWWITEHPAFMNEEWASVEIEITPHMVCKETNKIEDFEALNTTLQMWVEVLIPYYSKHDAKWGHMHDTDLDCGGYSWEEAVDNLYNLVIEHYGDYTEEARDKKRDEVSRIKSTTISSPPLSSWNSIKQPTGHGLRKPAEWFHRILSAEEVEIFEEERDKVIKTIKALTGYRETCNIEEYDKVDAEIEKQEFILFEHNLSLNNNIDLVRR